MFGKVLSTLDLVPVITCSIVFMGSNNFFSIVFQLKFLVFMTSV